MAGQGTATKCPVRVAAGSEVDMNCCWPPKMPGQARFWYWEFVVCLLCLQGVRWGQGVGMGSWRLLEQAPVGWEGVWEEVGWILLQAPAPVARNLPVSDPGALPEGTVGLGKPGIAACC